MTTSPHPEHSAPTPAEGHESNRRFAKGLQQVKAEG